MNCLADITNTFYAMKYYYWILSFALHFISRFLFMQTYSYIMFFPIHGSIEIIKRISDSSHYLLNLAKFIHLHKYSYVHVRLKKRRPKHELCQLISMCAQCDSVRKLYWDLGVHMYVNVNVSITQKLIMQLLGQYFIIIILL